MASKKIMIDMYYDIGSFYSYVAFVLVDRYTSSKWLNKVEFCLKPILLGGIFKATGNQAPISLAARQNYLLKDFVRNANWLGVNIQLPSKFPSNSLKVMRLLTAIKIFYPERLWYATNTLFKAYWGDCKEIDDEKTLFSILIESGEFSDSLASDLIRHTSELNVKNSLKEATEAAVELGLFGAPTFAVLRDEFQRKELISQVEQDTYSKYELFFGADRIPLMAHCLDLPWLGPLSHLQQNSFANAKL